MLSSCLRGVVTFDAASTTDAICSQANVGSVVLSDPEDPDTVVGISTIMNFKQWESSVVGINELKVSILSQVEKYALDNQTRQAFQNCMKHAACGAYLRATVVNLPQPILPPLMSSLVADVAWSIEECPDDLKNFYKLKQLVFLDRVKIHCNIEGTNKIDKTLISEVDAPVEETVIDTKKVESKLKSEDNEEDANPKKKRAKTVAPPLEKKKKTLKQPTAALYNRFKELCNLVLTGSEDDLAAHDGEELPSLDLAALVLHSDAIVLYATGRELEDSATRGVLGEKKKLSCAFEFAVMLTLPYKAIKQASDLLEKLFGHTESR